MTTIAQRAGFDPFATDLLADPYPSFAEYRKNQPVFYQPNISFLGPSTLQVAWD
jgi:hypothetical protein